VNIKCQHQHNNTQAHKYFLPSITCSAEDVNINSPNYFKKGGVAMNQAQQNKRGRQLKQQNGAHNEKSSTE
jgi:hypothetical protein